SDQCGRENIITARTGARRTTARGRPTRAGCGSKPSGHGSGMETAILRFGNDYSRCLEMASDRRPGKVVCGRYREFPYSLPPCALVFPSSAIYTNSFPKTSSCPKAYKICRTEKPWGALGHFAAWLTCGGTR